jgi:hypothetical protein
VMYENGLVIALMCWLFGNVALLVRINSQFNRNLHKVGSRLSWLGGNPTPLTDYDLRRGVLRKAGKFVLLFVCGFLLALTSWLYVALFLGPIIYRWSKDSGAPTAIKEARWKLKNRDLSFDEIVKLMHAAAESPPPLDEFRQRVLAEMHRNGLPVAHLGWKPQPEDEEA